MLEAFITGQSSSTLPRPDGPFADPDHPDVTHRFVQDGKKLRVETKVDDRIYKTMIDYAYGTTDRYVTMVGRDGEGGYRALRRSLFHEGKQIGWGRTSGDAGNTDKTEQVRGQPITVRDGVVRCLFCHVTNPREFRDPDKDGPGPEAADSGIGCERCHGPGANHILAAEADLADRAIVNVGPVSAEAVTAQCRVCHIVGDASEMRASARRPDLGSILRRNDDLQPLLHRVKRRPELPDLPRPAQRRRKVRLVLRTEVSLVPFLRFKRESSRDGLQGQPQPRLPDLPHAQGAHARAAHLADRSLHSGASGNRERSSRIKHAPGSSHRSPPSGPRYART